MCAKHLCALPFIYFPNLKELCKTMSNDIRDKVAAAADKYLSLEDIVAARTRRFLDVPLPALGGKIRIHSLTGKEYNDALDGARAEAGIPEGEGVDRPLAYQYLLMASAVKPTLTRDTVRVLFDQHMTVAQTIIQAIDTINNTVTGEAEDDQRENSFPVGHAQV